MRPRMERKERGTYSKEEGAEEEVEDKKRETEDTGKA